MKYDKACSSLRAAKEMIAITEKKLEDHSGSFDSTWQEMLNHADVRVCIIILFAKLIVEDNIDL